MLILANAGLKEELNWLFMGRARAFRRDEM